MSNIGTSIARIFDTSFSTKLSRRHHGGQLNTYACRINSPCSSQANALGTNRREFLNSGVKGLFAFWTIANGLVNANESSEDLAISSRNKFFESKRVFPKNGYKVPSNADLNQAKEILDIWKMHDARWRESRHINDHRELFYALVNKLGIRERYSNYSQDAFNQLILFELRDNLASLGVLIDLDKGEYSENGNPHYIFYYPHNDIFKVEEQQNITIKDLQGNSHSIPSVKVSPWPDTERKIPFFGLATNGCIVTTKNSEKDALNNIYEILEIVKGFSELYELRNIEFEDSLDKIDDLVVGNPFLLSISYSLMKVYYCKPLDEGEVRKAIHYHEGQHVVDRRTPKFEPRFDPSSKNDTHSSLLREYRARVNELQASPQFCLTSRLFERYNWNQYRNLPAEKRKDMDPDSIVSISAGTILFLQIIKAIKRDPAKYGIKIHRDLKVGEDEQIVCQFYKLLQGNKAAMLIEDLKPTLEKL